MGTLIENLWVFLHLVLVRFQLAVYSARLLRNVAPGFPTVAFQEHFHWYINRARRRKHTAKKKHAADRENMLVAHVEAWNP